MGEILKSLWRKYHLPRRLMLKFLSSALHHHIHETLTTPKATILPHLSVYPTFIWLAGPEISPEPKRAMLNIFLSTEAEDTTPMTSQSNIYIICKTKAWTVMLLLKQIKPRTLFMSFWDHNFPCPCPWLDSEHRGQRKCCWVCPLHTKPMLRHTASENRHGEPSLFWFWKRALRSDTTRPCCPSRIG